MCITAITQCTIKIHAHCGCVRVCACSVTAVCMCTGPFDAMK